MIPETLGKEHTMSATRERPMTTAEVAEATGIPAGTLQYWRHTGDGPAYMKLGRRVAYNPADVWDWLAAQTRTSTAGGAA